MQPDQGTGGGGYIGLIFPRWISLEFRQHLFAVSPKYLVILLPTSYLGYNQFGRLEKRYIAPTAGNTARLLSVVYWYLA